MVAGAAGVVRHNGVLRRNGVHEVPYYAVGTDRPRAVGQLVGPHIDEGVAFLSHLPDSGVVALAAVSHDFPASLYHLAQHQLGVANYGVVNVVVLVDVGGVVGGLNHGLARRDGHYHIVAGEAGANTEDNVGAANEVNHGAGGSQGGGTQGQRVSLREGALTQQCGGHRNLDKLGKLLEFLRGLSIHNSLARHNHRIPRRAQGAGSRLDIPGVRLGCHLSAGGIEE